MIDPTQLARGTGSNNVGSGLNGVLIEATGAFRGGDGLTPALARGYVTYGSDSGHQTPGDSFYQHAQAAANYSHEAVKRTKDLTTAFVEVYYGRAARRNYQWPGGIAGRATLLCRLRRRRFVLPGCAEPIFGPGLEQALALCLQYFRRRAQYCQAGAPRKGGPAACDTLDGAADGLVSDTAECRKAFNVNSLRCPDGLDTGNGCLSDPQIAALLVCPD